MCAAMLFPLIESLLPEDVLRTWSRQMSEFKTMKEKLEGLMKFLEREVQNEERIAMVRAGFQTNNTEKGANLEILRQQNSRQQNQEPRCRQKLQQRVRY